MTDVSLGTACESVQAYADSHDRIDHLNKGSLPILHFHLKAGSRSCNSSGVTCVHG